MSIVKRTQLVSEFTCLGDKCIDTCCQNWSMQVDPATLERYQTQAPELMDAVETSTDSPWIMRKDAATGMCVKLEGGFCGIHKKFGDSFLSDACHFYPRVTRALGEQAVMTATMSCPEVTRLALYNNDAVSLNEVSIDRLPQQLKNYLPAGLSPDDALSIHRAFLDAAVSEEFSAEMNFLRISSVARALSRVDNNSWVQGTAFYFRMAEGWIPPAEKNVADACNLLHALMGLVVASKKNPSPRLKETIDTMERALAVKLNWQHTAIDTTIESLKAFEAVKENWDKNFSEKFSPILKRYTQMQMSLSLFPFAGLGANLEERITLIGVRLATIKLALMCSCGTDTSELPQDVVVRVVQSLSRLLDHLGDPTFSLAIYKETGWVKENRLRGVIEL